MPIASTITAFTNPLTLAVAERLIFGDYHTLRTNQVYLDSNTTKGIQPATSTASTVTGSLILSTAQQLTITNVGAAFTLSVATGAGGILSVANTSAGSTIAGSIIFQQGTNIQNTISGQTFNFTVSSIITSLANTTALSTITGSAILQPGAFIGITASGQSFLFTNTGIQTVANTTAGSTLTGSIILQPGSFMNVTISGQSFNLTNTGIQSQANTTTGSTLTGSTILQPGVNVFITISGQSIVFSATALSSSVATGPSFYVYRTTNQALAANAHTKILWTERLFDTLLSFDTVTSTFTPSVTGTFLVGGACLLTGVGTFGALIDDFVFRIMRNDTTSGELFRVNQSYSKLDAATNDFDSLELTGLVKPSTLTDNYGLWVQSESSNAVTGNTIVSYFYGSKIEE